METPRKLLAEVTVMQEFCFPVFSAEPGKIAESIGKIVGRAIDDHNANANGTVRKVEVDFPKE